MVLTLAIATSAAGTLFDERKDLTMDTPKPTDTPAQTSPAPAFPIPEAPPFQPDLSLIGDMQRSEHPDKPRES